MVEVGVLEIANKKILHMENLIARIKEAEDLLTSLNSPALDNKHETMTDIEIGVPTHFMGRGWNATDGSSRWHRVRLKEDLGVTDIQVMIRELTAKATKERIKELKSELRKEIIHGEYLAERSGEDDAN